MAYFEIGGGLIALLGLAYAAWINVPKTQLPRWQPSKRARILEGIDPIIVRAMPNSLPKQVSYWFFTKQLELPERDLYAYEAWEFGHLKNRVIHLAARYDQHYGGKRFYTYRSFG